MGKKLSRTAIVLLLVCLISAPFASAQYTDRITVLGGLGGISRDALEEMLAAVACDCEGGSCGGGTCKCLCACEKCAFLRAHPQGSIYMSTTAGNPGATYGGSWDEWGQGRTPVGAAGGGVNPTYVDFDGVTKIFAAGETGGEYRHTLGIAESPAHSHIASGTIRICDTFGSYGGGGGSNGLHPSINAIGGPWSAEASLPTDSKGGGESHNNVQPYVACYMWRRTDANPVPFVCPDAPCQYCCSCGGGGGAGGSCDCEPYTATLPVSITGNDISIDLSGYVTTGGLTAALGGYVTSSALTTILGSYVTSTSLATTLTGYVTATALGAALNSYLLKSDVKAPLYIDGSGLLALKTTSTGYALVSNGTDAWTERGITDITLTSPASGRYHVTNANMSAFAVGTNLVTANALKAFHPDYNAPSSGAGTDVGTLGGAEIDTGTKWIDGSPVYQRTFFINTTIANNASLGWVTVVTGLTGIKMILDARWSGAQNNNTANTPYIFSPALQLTSAGVLGVLNIPGWSVSPSGGAWLTLQYVKA